MSPKHPLTCRKCDAPLDLTQRYCIECGARSRPVPRWAAQTLGLGQWVMTGTHPDPEAPKTPLTRPAAPITVGPFTIPWSAPTPRAAAIAVLSVLWFGIAIGAAGVASGRGPLAIFFGGGSARVAATTPLAPSAGNNGGGGDNGGSPAAASPQRRTITEIITSPNTSTTGTTTTSTGSKKKGTTGPVYPSDTGLPPIHHVWVIMLGDMGYEQSFASPDSYLHGLGQKGEVVEQEYGVAGSDLANEFAAITGQGPTNAIAQNCPKYLAAKGTLDTAALPYQFQGQGCVFPSGTSDLLDELTAKDFTWKAYVQGLGGSGNVKSMMLTAAGRKARAEAERRAAAEERIQKSKARAADAAHRSLASHKWPRTLGLELGAVLREASLRSLTDTSSTAHRHSLPLVETRDTCRHPVIGKSDPFSTVTAKGTYVTWRNPAVYLDSIIGSSGCVHNDVGTNALTSDLKTAKTTPNVSLIYPDPCDDGTATACMKGAQSGNKPLKAWLAPVIKQIMNSAAYKADGMIVVVPAMAPQTGTGADHGTCCGAPSSYPNLTGTTTTGSGTTTGTTGTTTSPAASTPSTETTPSTATGTGTGTTTGTTTTTTTPTTGPPGYSSTGGGGQTGMLILSPYVIPGAPDPTDAFNDFSILGSIEKIFGLGLTGYSANSSSANPVPLFKASLFPNYTG